MIGVVSSDAKARFARELGAHHVIDRQREPVGGRVSEITGGRGVDIIIDPIAGLNVSCITGFFQRSQETIPAFFGRNNISTSVVQLFTTMPIWATLEHTPYSINA